MTTAKSPAAFLAQAIPWVVLFVLWGLLSLVLGLAIIAPLKLLSWALRGIATGVELMLGALFVVLFAARPVPPEGTSGGAR